MTYAIRVHEFGGPEVLQWTPVEVSAPARGEVRVRHSAVGLNFIDVYERTGLYPGSLPLTPGHEAAGVIEAVGAGVRQLMVGDRVAYAAPNAGAYCEARVLPAERLVRLPEAISDEQAAGLMLKGLTAQTLVRQVHRVSKRDALLIHAAAGGVGSMLVQWARHLGAFVIAVVGSPQKAELARELGAHEALLSQEDWVEKTRALTQGQGVDVVYDSVGKDTFMRSLDCLRPRGLMVTFGNASGPVAPMAPLELSRRGSLFLTRPTLFHYIADRAALVKAAQDLFDLTARGVLRVRVDQRFALKDAAHAHRELESRRTTGATVLTV